MYTNQSCSVKWDNEQSDNFKIVNGARQGGVISPLLFSCYVDNLFPQLQHFRLGCHVRCLYAEAFEYADDIALFASSLQVCDCERVVHLCYFNTITITILQ